ncbi:MFS transporter [Actinomadura sp. DC4]|uniref:MFS transporter n=1 Tax=Actinomadura sp. DC4 TaxID=3055069 RepID=UPI0025AF7A3E|nr:MFS transporter [Actinomadura sp. DC4]MDN3355117.1 MFS transporter [Actinomadura sp. DC4]
MEIQNRTTTARPATREGRGRWPATAVFFLNGLTLSTYIVRLPSLKAEYGLTDGRLGLVGVFFGLAALASMQFVGPLVARVGSRPVLRASLVTMPFLLALLGVGGGPVEFALVATALGAVHGATDAAMNAYAVTVERLIGRPILNGCHAAWSVSAVVASLAAAALAHAGVGSTAHLVAAAAVLLAGGLLIGPLLPSTPPDAAVRERRGWRGGWTRTIIALGLTGTALMVCEGAALSWSAIFLHESRGASLGLAATAVTAYTAGQTGGRLAGDRLTLRFGASPVFRTGGLVAACGLAMAVLIPQPSTAVTGFAVMGLGTSVLLPLTFSAAGRAGGDAAVLVSRFTTFTYAGILLGPAVIGWTAELAGLAWTLSALIPVLLAVTVLSRLPDSAGVRRG